MVHGFLKEGTKRLLLTVKGCAGEALFISWIACTGFFFQTRGFAFVPLFCILSWSCFWRLLSFLLLLVFVSCSRQPISFSRFFPCDLQPMFWERNRKGLEHECLMNIVLTWTLSLTSSKSESYTKKCKWKILTIEYNHIQESANANKNTHYRRWGCRENIKTTTYNESDLNM